MTTLVLQPAELVQELIKIAQQKKTTPEALLSVVVKEFVQKQELPPASPSPMNAPSRKEFDAAFQGEVANFERMRPELLLRYPNQVVAMYQAKVIATGDDILQVYNAVVDEYGTIPCYVQRIASETPRKVRIPTAWKIR